MNLKHNREKKKYSLKDLCEWINATLSLEMPQFKINELDSSLLASKKHYVLKTKGKSLDIVIKYFNREIVKWNAHWENEITAYDILNMLNIYSGPKRIGVARGIIIYQFISGKTYQDLLLNQSLTNNAINQLANWYASLHSFNLIFGDSRLINFIWGDNQELQIIDSEDLQKTKEREFQMQDVAYLLCSFIDLSPGIFDNIVNSKHWEQMCSFLSMYCENSIKWDAKIKQFDRNSIEFLPFWNDIIYESLKKVIIRRKLSISTENMEFIKQTIQEKLDFFFL